MSITPEDTGLYEFPSYYDDMNELQDCTCGSCEEVKLLTRQKLIDFVITNQGYFATRENVTRFIDKIKETFDE